MNVSLDFVAYLSAYSVEFAVQFLVVGKAAIAGIHLECYSEM